MGDYAAPLDDMRFVLEEITDLAGLARLDGFEHADPETVAGVLAEAGRFFAEQFAPLDRVGECSTAVATTTDRHTPDGFAKAYWQYVDAGWPAGRSRRIRRRRLPVARRHGDAGGPDVGEHGVLAVPDAHPGCHRHARALRQRDQPKRYLAKMVTGEWTGTMNLTEPQAGSDLGALTTRAVPAGDGTWRITGQKIFITYGEHDLADNIMHFVLARVPDAPAGTRGISCFIVPKYLVEADGTPGERNGVHCLSIEHKMGINASPTCVLAYDDAVGYLVGEPNQGCAYVRDDEHGAPGGRGAGSGGGRARLPAGPQYARQRVQGQPVGPRPAPPSSSTLTCAGCCSPCAPNRGLRCLHYLNSECIDLSRRHPDEAVRAARAELHRSAHADLKAWCTELGVEVTSLALQVHGGMGYIEETGVAQHYRDSASRRSTRAPTGSRRSISSAASSASAPERRSGTC